MGHGWQSLILLAQHHDKTNTVTHKLPRFAYLERCQGRSQTAFAALHEILVRWSSQDNEVIFLTKRHRQVETDFCALPFTPNDLYPLNPNVPRKTIIVFHLTSHELVINKQICHANRQRNVYLLARVRDEANFHDGNNLFFYREALAARRRMKEKGKKNLSVPVLQVVLTF